MNIIPGTVSLPVLGQMTDDVTTYLVNTPSDCQTQIGRYENQLHKT